MIREKLNDARAKLNDVQAFPEKYNLNKIVANIMNDNVVSFRTILQHRKKQISLNRFVVKMIAMYKPEVKRQKREKPSEGQLPIVIMEMDSPSEQ